MSNSCPLVQYGGKLNKSMLLNSYVAYIIERSETESQDFRRFDMFFEQLKSHGEIACQRVLVFFGGYDDDPRELIEIEPVTAYIQEIHNRQKGFLYHVLSLQSLIFIYGYLPQPSHPLTEESKKFTVILESNALDDTLTTLAQNLIAYSADIQDPRGAQRAWASWIEQVKNNTSSVCITTVADLFQQMK